MKTSLPLALDHTVINVHFEMDRAQAIFESLGFCLTPRGRHSLGSINHLIVLEDDYVEIVGLPTDTDTLRQEVLNSPIGIDGLVFKPTMQIRLTKRSSKRGSPSNPYRPFLARLNLMVRPMQRAFVPRALRPEPMRQAGCTFASTSRRACLAQRMAVTCQQNYTYCRFFDCGH